MSDDNLGQDLVGKLFKVNKSYWKITGPSRKLLNIRQSFPVIRCTKTGKEFKETNGFSVDFVLKQVLFSPLSNDKVNTDNKENGRKKARLKYLRNKIELFQKEVTKLEAEIY